MSQSAHQYQEKFDRIVGQTSFALLPGPEREYLKARAFDLRFTLQELRQVSEMALDRVRWKESPLSRDWPDMPVSGDSRAIKKKALSNLAESQALLQSRLKHYDEFTQADRPQTQKPILRTRQQPALGLGRCPVASERTRCCNLLTLDAVEKCGFDCSYCSIQSFYHGNEVVFDSGFADKLAKLKLNPDTIYHIGTGQSSDSLMWGNHQGVLEALCDFAENNPNVILELKTKSKNIGWLLKNPVPRNVICTWSLNPQTIIDHEEHLSASLEQRIGSARALADKGCIVGFHFHPIIHYQGWDVDYKEICDSLTGQFDPREIALVSMGTLTFTRSVMKTIRNRDLTSKILQMPMEDSAGKLSYPIDVKLDLFGSVYQYLAPWHEKVFFYLCMESQALWMPVFGHQYDSNEVFEKAMKDSYMSKIHNDTNINS